MITTAINSASLPSTPPSVNGASDRTQILLDTVPRHQPLEATNPTSDALDPDASILLLGIRGTGRTTLAILASSVIGFQLVDADQHFYKTTGLSRALYASRHGFDAYKAKEIDLMRELLQQNPRRCILVCGPGSAEGTGQSIIRDFRKGHPVIFILRDPSDVHDYLGTQDIETVSELAKLVGPSYRSLSNFEFYNLSEPDVANSVGSHFQNQIGFKPSSHPSLLLKHVEDDFLRLIQGIRSQLDEPRVFQAQHSLSHLPPEAKPYSYALQLPLDQVPEVAFRLRSTDLIVDAVELEINTEALFTGGEGCVDQSTATFITKQYYALRRSVKLPIIFHVRVGDSRNHGLQTFYVNLLFHGLRLAPEYLTLHLLADPALVKDVVAHKRSTKIIGHIFDQRPMDGAWGLPNRAALLQRAESLGCDLVRICQPAKTPEDNIMAQQFTYQARRSTLSDIPLIAYNTGRIGLTSCFMNSTMTPVSLDLPLDLSESGTGERLTVRAAQQALYSSFILDKLVFGIFGNAVSASISPQMQNAAFEFCGMPHVYQTFQSPTVHDLQHLIYHDKFGGASISAPFKQEIITILDYISPEAQAIGAVNTLIPLRSRKLESLVDRNHAGPVLALYGDNTDWIGIHMCISSHLSPINAVKSRTTALILGAGGMARAAIYAALRLGVQNIFVWNRTPENTRSLVNQYHAKPFVIRRLDLAKSSPNTSPQRSGTVTPRNQKIVGPAKVHELSSLDDPWPSWAELPTIVVSCISRASKRGQPSPTILLPDSWLKSPTGGVLIELSYNPVTETPLLQQVRRLGDRKWIPVDGLQVLPEQGSAQFELFTGRTAPRHLMRAKAAECRILK
ncbi:hypothetical protein Plec18170_007391 [Paecilomyces lecythidis]